MSMEIKTMEDGARALVELVRPVGTEEIPLTAAWGRVCAQDVRANHPVPPFRRSAFDGFALCTADTAKASPEHPVTLRITEKLGAGDSPKKTVTCGWAARIMTGAVVPEGADGVVMHEKTVFTEESVTLTEPVAPGNIVGAGEDSAVGKLLAQKGQRLSPSSIAQIVGQGRTTVTVYKKPRAALISTGSELLPVGSDPVYGKIYNTNPYLLGGYLEKYGIQPEYLGIVPDDLEQLRAAVGQAMEEYDIVLTTGGVSAGDYDHMPQAAREIGGQILFHKLKFKPGGAMLAACRRGKLLLALSGNPGAAATGLLCVGLPCLKRMCGLTQTELLCTTALLGADFPKASARERIVKGKAEFHEGMLYFIPSGNQYNGSVSSMEECDLLAVIPAGSGPLPKGSRLKVHLL